MHLLIHNRHIMKKNLFALIFIIPSLLFSCSQEENLSNEQDIIRLTTSIAPMNRGVSINQQSTQIEDGRKVGVTIMGASLEHFNQLWITNPYGELLNTTDSIYWAENDITIYAYHPHQVNWNVNSSVNRFEIQTDQSETGYLDSDLLWTSQTAKKSTSPIAMTFTHKLSKINVILTSEDIADLSNATIRICNTKPSVGINIQTGELTQSLSNELVDIKAGVTTSNEYTSAAIIVPQTQKAGTKFIDITHNGNSYYFTLPEDKEFKSGYSYSYTLKINKKPIEVSVVSEMITDWNNEDINGEASNVYTLQVNQAGSLPTLISETDKYALSSIKITGELNGTDIRYIREMIGRDVNGGQTSGKLTELDINNARIVTGGDYYYKDAYSGTLYYTENDAIGECMFTDCDRLKTIKLPVGLTSIKSSAFAYCHKLRSLTIPDNVSQIGSSAFFYCNSFTSIDIHSKVIVIEDNAFGACGITNINVAADNPNYSSIDGVLFTKDQKTLVQYAKDKIQPNYTIPDGVTTIGSCAFYAADKLISIVIPQDVTTIDHGAFYACSSLKRVSIHSGVTNIIGQAFGAGGSLYIDISEDNPNYSSIDGVLFTKDKKTLLQYSLHDVNPHYTVPNGVTTIGVNAFYACGSLKSVSFPNTVTKIEGGVFIGCYELTSVTFPNSLTYLGDHIFGKDTPVTEIHCQSVIPPTSCNSFTEFNTSACTLYVPQGSKNDYETANYWNTFINITEENL